MLKEYTRSLRIAKELKKEISIIIHRNLTDPRVNKIISVSSIDVSNQLDYAKVFIIILNKENCLETKDKVVQVLNHASGYIKFLLSKKLRLRIIPKLTFIYDYSFLEGIKISKIIKNLLIENKK